MAHEKMAQEIFEKETMEQRRYWLERLSRETGIDAAPEGGCALGVLEKLVRAGAVAHDAEVVLFNTGSGASYRF